MLNSRFLLVIYFIHAAATAKLLQSCLTLCDPIDSSPLGSPIPGIIQARPLEWVAISICNSSVIFPGGTRDKEPVCQCRRCKKCKFDL